MGMRVGVEEFIFFAPWVMGRCGDPASEMFVKERSDLVSCLESVRKSIDYLGGLVDHLCMIYDIRMKIIFKGIEHGYHNEIRVIEGLLSKI